MISLPRKSFIRIKILNAKILYTNKFGYIIRNDQANPTFEARALRSGS